MPLKYGPVAQCIYCRISLKPLDREHIVPLSISGRMELIEASCPGCATVTRDIEQYVARKMMGNFRIRFGFPTRHKRQRSTTLPVVKVIGELEEEIQILVADYPASMPVVWLNPAGLLIGRDIHEDLSFKIQLANSDAIRGRDIGADWIKIQGEFNPSIYGRFLAKISHAFAVYWLGLDGFIPLLIPTIMNGYSPYHYVGGSLDFIPPSGPPDRTIHTLEVVLLLNHFGQDLVLVDLRLFANWVGFIPENMAAGTPKYKVVVGRLNPLTYKRFRSGPFYPVWTRRSNGKSLFPHR